MWNNMKKDYIAPTVTVYLLGECPLLISSPTEVSIIWDEEEEEDQWLAE